MPAWTPEFALDFMDRHDIATELLSLPSHLSKEEARKINEYGAIVGRAVPRTLGLLAALPMDDVKATLSEIAFASINSMPTGNNGHELQRELPWKLPIRTGIRRTKQQVCDDFCSSD